MTRIRHWNLRRHMAASLERGGLERDHDPGLHFLNEWDRIVHELLPAMLVPGRVPDVLPGLKIFISPKMVHHIELPNLREESPNCLITVLSKANGPGPVVAPLDHCSWSELVGPEFVYIGARSWHWLIPETELQQQLVLPGEKHVTSGLSEIYKFLVFFEFIHDLREGWIASFIPPEMDCLILLAIPRVPRPHQGTRVLLAFVDLW